MYSLNITVPASSVRRLVSDSVAGAPPPSWATPAPIVTNFIDFTYFASLSLPQGVKAEGYTLFNPGTGTVNPRLDQGAVPLVFQSGPTPLLAPGLVDLGTVPVATTSITAGGVPRGTFHLQVRAVNAAGTGPASASVQLVVP